MAGDYERAIADYAEAIRVEPTNVRAYVLRTLEYAYNGNYNYHDLIADYSAIIALEPNEAYRYEQRAHAYHEGGNDEAAMADYNMSIQLEPQRSDGYLRRARLRAHLSDYAGAIADCDMAIRLEPNSYIFYEGKGDIYYDMGDLNAAIREYTIQINLFPNNSEGFPGFERVWNARAWAYYRLGDYGAAMLDVNEAIRRDITLAHWQFRYTRGAIYAALNQVANAISDYQAALSLIPNEKTEQAILGYIAQWL